MSLTIAFIILICIAQEGLCQSGAQVTFAPNIAASCKQGYMYITVNVNNIDYRGIVHPWGYRKDPCVARGDGTKSVTLRIALIDEKDDPNYCGVQVNQTTKEKYLPIVVRFHETLEVAEDKFYTIKCGLQGFVNSRNQTSYVNLEVRNALGEGVKEATFDHPYTLEADISGPDKDHVMRIHSCVSFSEANESFPLTDDLGCPAGDYPVIGPFVYNDTEGKAVAPLHNMFRFPDSNRVHIQCDVLICKRPCEQLSCSGRPERLTETQQGRALPDSGGASDNKIEDRMVKAATSVYILSPSGYQTCGWHPRWLWILCLALAVLFIIMMIINIFLCSAVTCSCNTSETIEKDPSCIEDYDPYRSWHGSQYGSRHSLNGKGYASGASTMNSARSVSSHSDHYAIVHNRPDSRYSGHHSLKHERNHYPRSPVSTTGSHYSNRIN